MPHSIARDSLVILYVCSLKGAISWRDIVRIPGVSLDSKISSIRYLYRAGYLALSLPRESLEAWLNCPSLELTERGKMLLRKLRNYLHSASSAIANAAGASDGSDNSDDSSSNDHFLETKVPSESPSPEDVLSRDYLAEQIRCAVYSLPRPLRDVIRQYYGMDTPQRSVRSIAHTLGCSRMQVYRLLEQAKEQLREMLAHIRQS